MNHFPLAEITAGWTKILKVLQTGTRNTRRNGKKQHRHSACIKHKFKIRDKVLLKKRKINKWSTAHEKDYYEIIEIHSSIIGARRKSDDRTIHRDASNFKLLLRESGDESCGENHRVSEIDRTHPAQKRKR